MEFLNSARATVARDPSLAVPACPLSGHSPVGIAHLAPSWQPARRALPPAASSAGPRSVPRCGLLLGSGTLWAELVDATRCCSAGGRRRLLILPKAGAQWMRSGQQGEQARHVREGRVPTRNRSIRKRKCLSGKLEAHATVARSKCKNTEGRRFRRSVTRVPD